MVVEVVAVGAREWRFVCGRERAEDLWPGWLLCGEAIRHHDRTSAEPPRFVARLGDAVAVQLYHVQALERGGRGLLVRLGFIMGLDGFNYFIKSVMCGRRMLEGLEAKLDRCELQWPQTSTAHPFL